MKWKILLALVVVVTLAAAAGYGWYQWDRIQTERRIAETLTLVKNQVEMGNHERAQVNIEELLRNHPDIQHADAVRQMLANSYRETGDTEQAARVYADIIEKHPDSVHVADALVFLAESAYDQGDTEQAEKLWDQVLTRFKGTEAIDDARFGKARLMYDRGEIEKAQAELETLRQEFPDSNRMAGIEDLLGKLNLDLLLSRTLQPGDEIYKIQRGDTLQSIAKRHNVPAELLQRVNHIRDARNLSVGRRLKIPKVDFSVVIDKTENSMLLLDNGDFFKRYPVRTGKERWMTPAGEYRILRKVKDPAWNNPIDHRTYPPGDPENELGTRWMAFEGSSLGIHGTIHPETIGDYASNGCVGMLKEDVEEVFDLLPVGTPVKIVGRIRTRGDQEEG